MSYRRALRWIEELDPGRTDSDEVALLRESAEALLLDRGAPGQAEELGRSAGLILQGLLDRGVVTRTRASEIRHALRAAGPPRTAEEAEAVALTSPS